VSKHNILLGRSGEDSAVDFLKKSGYKILARNYRNYIGEIDIIARDKETIVFVEVKTRTSEKCGFPAEAVSVFKQRQISRTAIMYLKENNLLQKSARFDIISVLCLSQKEKVDLIKNAFELDSRFLY